MNLLHYLRKRDNTSQFAGSLSPLDRLAEADTGN